MPTFMQRISLAILLLMIFLEIMTIFFAVTKNDPLTPWYNQGWWGNPNGWAHCNITGNLVAEIYFPRNAIVQEFGNNNAAAILQPDNVTVLQMQPLYRCEVGSPVLALDYWLYQNESILGEGLYGAHGGSGLSSIGGTIRLGELLTSSGDIRHSLKLELYAHDYYYKGNPCYVWPALDCDDYHNDCKDNPQLCYGGNNYYLKPGALLAVPENVYQRIKGQMKTLPAGKI